jgi:hypothetical protein
MMKKLSFLSLLVLVYTPAAIAVETEIEFGQYINCKVINSSNRPIAIQQVVYGVTTSSGPLKSVYPCGSGCVVPARSTTKMTGPRNSSAIGRGKCNVNFRYLPS